MEFIKTINEFNVNSLLHLDKTYDLANITPSFATILLNALEEDTTMEFVSAKPNGKWDTFITVKHNGVLKEILMDGNSSVNKIIAMIKKAKPIK